MDGILPSATQIGWLIAIAGMVVGLLLGSFSTMLSYRLPRRESIVWPRSHCSRCKSVLGVRDLVPLVSWLLLRGQCRHCGGAISARYPIIEATTALGALLLFRVIGWDVLLVPALAALILIVTAVAVLLERTAAKSP